MKELKEMKLEGNKTLAINNMIENIKSISKEIEKYTPKEETGDKEIINQYKEQNDALNHQIEDLSIIINSLITRIEKLENQNKTNIPTGGNTQKPKNRMR